MLSETRSLIDELDAALSKASDSQNLTMLQRVTHLFLAGSEYFSEDHVAIFDEVICRLIEKIEPRALVQLSTILAPVSKAPINVMARLSRSDNILVSGPILERSNVLTNQTLIEIAGTKGQKHLAAIAGRMRIGETVTDILVDRGSSEVAHKVTANQGARFSELGFVKLIGRAKTDRSLAALIATRTDMPPELEPFLNLALAS